MTAPVITGGSVSGVTFSSAAATITGGSVSGVTFSSSAATITGGSVTGVTFSSSAATITGGSVSGITDLAIADGGTGASTAANARVNLGVDNYGMLKNRIINGQMTISQRGTSFAGLTNGTNGFTLDRWFWNESGTSTAVQTVAQSTSVPSNGGFSQSLQVTTTTAQPILASNNTYRVGQPIEGFNIADLMWGTASAKSVTLSFWVRSSLTGTFGGVVYNNGLVRCYVYSYTINAADTWEYKTVTIDGDTTGTWATNNTFGLAVEFSLGAGSDYLTTPGSWGSTRVHAPTGQVNVAGTLNATFYITGVQIEVGTQATSFEYRQYGTELSLCQRYYFRFSASGGGIKFGIASNATTTKAYAITNFPVPMRAEPSALEQSGTASHYTVLAQNSVVTCSSVPAFSIASTVNAETDLTFSSGLTAGNVSLFRAASSSAFLGWSAEL
jgi:hypothetical protein